jgi:hypothetical protein
VAKEYVPIFFDWLEVTQDLTPDEKGNLIDAVVAYASGKDFEHLLVGGVKIAFRFLKGQVDRNNAISEARSNARTNKPEQNETSDNKPEQNESNLPKEKEKEKEKENKNDKEKKSRTKFTPPTVEEVAAYCRERNNGIDPEYFCAYYAKQDWFLANGRKMTDWKMAVVTWEKKEKHSTQPKAQPTKTVVAQQYDQRSYDDVSREIMEDQIRDMEKWMRERGSA